MDTSFDGNKVGEALNDNVVVEIWKKESEEKVYFDVVCKSALEIEGVRCLSSYLFARNIPSLVIAVIRAMEYISVCHREMRRSGTDGMPEATVDIVTSWDPMGTVCDEDDLEFSRTRQVKEIKCGAIVTELYINRDGVPMIRCRREFPADGQWKRSQLIQQRDLRDLIISATEVWKHLVESEGDDAKFPEGNMPGAQGGFYQE